MSTIVKVEFGVKGHKQVREVMKRDGADFTTQYKDYLNSYLLDEFMNEVKRQGFRSIGRARFIFEEAIDYQSKFEASRIISRLNESHGMKVPKYAIFTLEAGHAPRVE